MIDEYEEPLWYDIDRKSYISPLLPSLVTSALKMETAYFFETTLTYKTTQRQDPKQPHYINRRENVKSHLFLSCLSKNFTDEFEFINFTAKYSVLVPVFIHHMHKLVPFLSLKDT
jgi:hypothetical protein